VRGDYHVFRSQTQKSLREHDLEQNAPFGLGIPSLLRTYSSLALRSDRWNTIRIWSLNFRADAQYSKRVPALTRSFSLPCSSHLSNPLRK
jgi:hypothetical protein